MTCKRKRLKVKEDNETKNCSRCQNNELETAEHALRDCETARPVWDMAKQLINLMDAQMTPMEIYYMSWDSIESMENIVITVISTAHKHVLNAWMERKLAEVDNYVLDLRRIVKIWTSISANINDASLLSETLLRLPYPSPAST